MKSDPTFWILARASGMTAYVLLTTTVLAGLLLRARPFSTRLKAATVTDLHRFLSMLALGAVGIHGLALVLDRLGAHGEDLGIVEYYRGEINRIRRGEGDRERAIQHYTNAIAQADAPAAAWRELGEYASRDGRNDEAAAFFTTYLERAPEAPDRALVEARIGQLTGGGQ